jgi:ECF transporter S component (folate family)
MNPRLLKIVYTGLFAAISVVVSVLEVNIGTARVTFNYTVLFLAGALLGPLCGFLSGAIGDVLGFLIRPSGIFNPIFTISAGLIGLIAGLVFGKERRLFSATVAVSVLKTVLSFVLIYVFITVLLNSTSLFVFYKHGASGFMAFDTEYFKGGTVGADIIAFITARLAVQTVVWAINFGLSALLYLPAFTAYRYRKVRMPQA